ncbi:MAG TPA: MurR/RpiR family transcriptional regulator [Ramlibacter sp.]|uniref:MurR/RpiR family transcriptional regulator n=1 Tax=Ramlibacter sp. TaxID=1917967 RepID=UPI002ED41A5E
MSSPRSGNPSLAQRIARVLPALTPSHRQIADWVLAHPLHAATMPIDELAATVGVSVATANRFARALEFEGYAQFRAALVLGFETTLAPVEKLRSKLERSATVGEVCAGVLADIQQNIAATRQALDAQACERAVEAILRARRVYVVGFGASSWLAGLLQRGLDAYHENVHALPTVEGASFAAKVLARAQAADLLVAIAFPRYLADTVRLARLAHERGMTVLALTDRVTSPLAPLADVSLYADVDSHYFAASEASALPLIEALCSAVAHRAKGSVHAATQLAESVLPWLHDGERGNTRAGTQRAAPPARGQRTATRRATPRTISRTSK